MYFCLPLENFFTSTLDWVHLLYAIFWIIYVLQLKDIEKSFSDQEGLISQNMMAQ